MKRWLLAIGLTVLASTCYCLPARSAERLALLVAIGRYRAADVPVLDPNGEIYDAKRMSDALQQHGFRAENIKTLSESDATKQEIMNALNSLAARAQPDDVVVFYFSGHGGRTQGHLSLCPYDSTRQDSKNDLTDQDLKAWVEQLKTTNVTIILDCCFTEYHVKAFRRYPKFMPRPDESPAQPLGIPEDRAVILKASRDDEEAQEANFGKNRTTGEPIYVGVFTQPLSQELELAHDELTYQGLMDRVQADVSRYLAAYYAGDPFNQNPQIQGSDQQRNRKLFAPLASEKPNPPPIPPPPTPPAPAPPPPYVVLKKVSGDKIILDRGQSAGVTPGSEYAIYPPGETKFAPEDKIGEMRITQVSLDSAVAAPEGSPAARAIKANCRAVETRHAENIHAKARVSVKVEAPQDSQTKIEQALQGLGYAGVDTTKPDLVLKVSQANGNLSGSLYGPDGKIPVQQDENPVEAQAGGPEDLVAKMAPYLENIIVLRGLAAINNPSPSFTVNLQTDKTLYQLDDKLHVKLKVNTKQDCYLALIHVSAEGVPQMLFPNVFSNATQIHGNHDYTIPSQELGKEFKITITPPTGRETIIAIATLDPVDWNQALRSTPGSSLKTLNSKGIDVAMSDVQDRPVSRWATALVNFVIDMPDSSPKPQAGQEQR